MPFSVTEQKAKPTVHAIGLSVEQSGMTVTVKAGTFKMSGVDYEFTEDQDFVATADPTDDTVVTGYLTREIATGNPVLVVDEEVLDGSDVPFNFQGSAYKLLHKFYQLRVPAGATDLDAVDIQVFSIVEPPAPPVAEEVV